MIILDIDGTLVDHNSAEEQAARAFGALYAGVIPEYSAPDFPRYWWDVSERHMGAFLAGRISFAEQRARMWTSSIRRRVSIQPGSLEGPGGVGGKDQGSFSGMSRRGCGP